MNQTDQIELLEKSVEELQVKLQQQEKTIYSLKRAMTEVAKKAATSGFENAIDLATAVIGEMGICSLKNGETDIATACDLIIQRIEHDAAFVNIEVGVATNDEEINAITEDLHAKGQSFETMVLGGAE